MLFAARKSLLRTRHGHDHHRVTFVELFFDLVFVFAVTQLSHGLLAHLDWAGAAQMALLMMAMWWTWITVSWVTNWLDPEKAPVRLWLFSLMFGGLLLAGAIPHAFEAPPYPKVFAYSYAAIHALRIVFMLWALRRHSPGNGVACSSSSRSASAC